MAGEQYLVVIVHRCKMASFPKLETHDTGSSEYFYFSVWRMVASSEYKIWLLLCGLWKEMTNGLKEMVDNREETTRWSYVLTEVKWWNIDVYLRILYLSTTINTNFHLLDAPKNLTCIENLSDKCYRDNNLLRIGIKTIRFRHMELKW